MLMLMLASMMISFMFFLTNHPLSMGFNLLVQTIIISLMTGMINLNFWYSFILFLIMVGGMLVLFIYMTSVASNEKFKPSTTLVMVILAYIMVMSLTTLLVEPLVFKTDLSLQLTQMMTMKKNMWSTSLIKFITYPHNLKLIMMMSYLFLALVAIVKITNIKYGPLRTN
uniref:NADH dehydrogenase subunit 6 n=1 Tax=Agrilus adelphinus TaxID=2201944 RepID=UPI0023AA261B|nr:NADH dehydrogenase subunit 6 [Agrilus adelphinus]WCO09274.1 NADH dehydrogenase subunit 6 [Agrilus adelphinus]